MRSGGRGVPDWHNTFPEKALLDELVWLAK